MSRRSSYSRIGSTWFVYQRSPVSLLVRGYCLAKPVHNVEKVTMFSCWYVAMAWPSLSVIFVPLGCSSSRPMEKSCMISRA